MSWSKYLPPGPPYTGCPRNPVQESWGGLHDWEYVTEAKTHVYCRLCYRAVPAHWMPRYLVSRSRRMNHLGGSA